MKIIQCYEPVIFKDGSLAVQIREPNSNNLLGWGDGLSKYDKPGTWSIADTWHPQQAIQLALAIARLKEFGRVTVKEDGISRIVTCQI